MTGIATIFNFSTFLTIVFVTSLVAQILIFIYHISIYDPKNTLQKSFLHLMLATFLLTMSTILAFLSESKEEALLGHTISLALYDVLIFHFFCYTEVYTTDGKYSIKHIWLAGIIMLLDIANLLFNLIYHQIICIKTFFIAGSIYYGYIPVDTKNFHWYITIFIVLISLFKLLFKTFSVPHIYRRQYFSVFLSVFSMVLLYLLFHIIDLEVELSTLLVPYIIILTYYFTFLQAPKAFIRQTRLNIIRDLNYGIVIIDKDGTYKDSNSMGQKFVSIDESSPQTSVDSWIERHGIDITSHDAYEFRDTQLEGEPYLRVRCNQQYEPETPDMLSGTYIMIRDITEDVKKVEDKLFASRHDMLTGQYNRNGFYEEASDYLTEQTNLDHYIICTDIENFKLFNTLFGEKDGDTFLKNIGDALSLSLSNPIVIGRIGGDRFAILIKKEDFNENDFTQAFATALSESGKTNYSINVYLGVYEVFNTELSVSDMFDRAVIAAQSIKGHPDDFVAYYDKSLTEDILKEQENIDEIRHALVNEEFVFFLQPQVTNEGKTIGGEALVRWQHPQRGIISPFFFIQTMEEHGMIADLDYMIWSKACKKLRQWKDMGREDMHISVNISPKDFYYKDIYATFTKLVEENGIRPDRLKLEITESAVMQNQEEQIALIDKLRAYGFTVEMDDFGSGYSSLSMLNQIHVDVLKIDMAFLQQGVNTQRSHDILELIQGLAKTLGMTSIVEGVETQEQADFLKSIGCDIFQGYLFSPPIPVDEFESKWM